MRKSASKNRIFAAGLVLLSGAMIAGLLVIRSVTEGDAEVSGPRWAPGGQQEYPEEWKTTLDIATASARFGFVLPNHPNANPANMTAVYLWPDGATVALQFPPPAVAVSVVRQEYIEVWESPWAGGDPSADFAADMAAAPAEGKGLYDINGVPALGVTAHSPSDLEQANPAFLRFVYDDIEFEISGGEDINLLIEIAKTIVAPPAA